MRRVLLVCLLGMMCGETVRSLHSETEIEFAPFHLKRSFLVRHRKGLILAGSAITISTGTLLFMVKQPDRFDELMSTVKKSVRKHTDNRMHSHDIYKDDAVNMQMNAMCLYKTDDVYRDMPALSLIDVMNSNGLQPLKDDINLINGRNERTALLEGFDRRSFKHEIMEKSGLNKKDGETSILASSLISESMLCCALMQDSFESEFSDMFADNMKELFGNFGPEVMSKMYADTFAKYAFNSKYARSEFSDMFADNMKELFGNFGPEVMSKMYADGVATYTSEDFISQYSSLINMSFSGMKFSSIDTEMSAGIARVRNAKMVKEYQAVCGQMYYEYCNAVNSMNMSYFRAIKNNAQLWILNKNNRESLLKSLKVSEENVLRDESFLRADIEREYEDFSKLYFSKILEESVLSWNYSSVMSEMLVERSSFEEMLLQAHGNEMSLIGDRVAIMRDWERKSNNTINDMRDRALWSELQQDFDVSADDLMEFSPANVRVLANELYERINDYSAGIEFLDARLIKNVINSNTVNPAGYAKKMYADKSVVNDDGSENGLTGAEESVLSDSSSGFTYPALVSVNDTVGMVDNMGNSLNSLGIVGDDIHSDVDMNDSGSDGFEGNIAYMQVLSLVQQQEMIYRELIKTRKAFAKMKDQYKDILRWNFNMFESSNNIIVDISNGKKLFMNARDILLTNKINVHPAVVSFKMNKDNVAFEVYVHANDLLFVYEDIFNNRFEEKFARERLKPVLEELIQELDNSELGMTDDTIQEYILGLNEFIFIDIKNVLFRHMSGDIQEFFDNEQESLKKNLAEQKVTQKIKDRDLLKSKALRDFVNSDAYQEYYVTSGLAARDKQYAENKKHNERLLSVAKDIGYQEVLSDTQLQEAMPMAFVYIVRKNIDPKIDNTMKIVKDEKFDYSDESDDMSVLNVLYSELSFAEKKLNEYVAWCKENDANTDDYMFMIDSIKNSIADTKAEAVLVILKNKYWNYDTTKAQLIDMLNDKYNEDKYTDAGLNLSQTAEMVQIDIEKARCDEENEIEEMMNISDQSGLVSIKGVSRLFEKTKDVVNWTLGR